MINAALPVSFEIEYEAISKLQKTLVAFIHLRKCLFRFRTDTPWLSLLFCSGGSIYSGEYPAVHLCVDPQQPH